MRKSLEENIETSFEECAQEYCMELMRIPEEKDLTEVSGIFCAFSLLFRKKIPSVQIQFVCTGQKS